MQRYVIKLRLYPKKPTFYIFYIMPTWENHLKLYFFKENAIRRISSIDCINSSLEYSLLCRFSG